MGPTDFIQPCGPSAFAPVLAGGTATGAAETPPSNQDIRELLATQVSERFLGGGNAVWRGPLVTNDWSFCIELRRLGRDGTDGTYIKIPKDEIDRTRILPITPGAARMAHEEYASLRRLEGTWSGDDLGVFFVRPLAFLEECNAIVTGRIDGGPFLDRFRLCDIRRRLGSRGAADEIAGAMRRLGRALGRFHRQGGRVVPWSGADFAVKLRRIAGDLAGLGLPDDICRRVERMIWAIEGERGESLIGDTLKGLDVRNILHKADTLYLLDPGKTKEDFCDADVARFLMTCRILWWGHPLFGLGFAPAAGMEDAFLAGYRVAGASAPLLSVHMFKELLKTWRMAYQAVNTKGWPAGIGNMVRRVYIDPFFRRQLAAGYPA